MGVRKVWGSQFWVTIIMMNESPPSFTSDLGLFAKREIERESVCVYIYTCKYM